MVSAVRGGTVLLVEDDEELTGAFRLVLEARGLEVETASSAREAESRLRGDGATTVVADLGLPDAAGTEVVRRLRSAAPDARVLVLTGEDDAETRHRCLEAGADEFMVKPVSGRDLADYLAG